MAIDRTEPEAFALSQLILRGVTAGLQHYLGERPLFQECCPDQALFVNPIFNIQHYAPGEGFKRWHCDWTIGDEATEPVHRVLAWILFATAWMKPERNSIGKTITSLRNAENW